MPPFRLKRILLGEPLATLQAHHERIPKWKALSTLSSDALSSVAYATDSILLVLAASAMTSGTLAWSIPIAIGITILLGVITASYRQTIAAYPNGGGAYIVVKDNIGTTAGLLAGGALLIDYVLTVSVSVSAGMENLAAAFPVLGPHRVALGLGVILIIMLMNLRGIRDSSTIFSFPTYFFIFSIFSLLGVGFFRVIFGPAIPIGGGYEDLLHVNYAAVPAILVLRAFASGCSALTGVEAISDGVAVFKQPAAQNARTTLVWMSIILGGMFLGITSLGHVLRLVPTEDQPLISLLGRAVFDNGFMYYALQAATASILFLAANTSYADFPRLASLLAKDRFMPRQLAMLGDRLVFSNGIIGLSFFAALLIIFFGGDTHQLIPLYAVGVFLSFTLSQTGMVLHHLKHKQKGYRFGLSLNALGATTTAVVLVDIAYTKFVHGAWIVILALPILILFFKRINAHYLSVGRELSLIGKTPPPRLNKVKHTVIMPVSGIHQGVLEAAQYSTTISDDVRACYVEVDPESTERMREQWNQWLPQIPFVILRSPYRSVLDPLIQYIDDVEKVSSDDLVTVVIPEFVTAKWWHQLLHNHTATFIRAALGLRRRKVVTSVRYHLRGM